MVHDTGHAAPQLLTQTLLFLSVRLCHRNSQIHDSRSSRPWLQASTSPDRNSPHTQFPNNPSWLDGGRTVGDLCEALGHCTASSDIPNIRSCVTTVGIGATGGMVISGKSGAQGYDSFRLPGLKNIPETRQLFLEFPPVVN